MKTIKTISAMIVASTLLVGAANTASAAVYVKMGDIKGESRATSTTPSAPATTTRQISSGSNDTRTLLLPAVQQAREAARRTN